MESYHFLTLKSFFDKKSYSRRTSPSPWFLSFVSEAKQECARFSALTRWTAQRCLKNGWLLSVSDLSSVPFLQFTWGKNPLYPSFRKSSTVPCQNNSMPHKAFCINAKSARNKNGWTLNPTSSPTTSVTLRSHARFLSPFPYMKIWDNHACSAYLTECEYQMKRCICKRFTNVKDYRTQLITVNEKNLDIIKQ